MTYTLLDSGDGQKLEQIGDYKIQRQAAQAFWAKTEHKSSWQDVDATHIRSNKGGGHWEFHRKVPDSWVMDWGGFQFKAKLTPFGHIGLFPEQAENWAWIGRQLRDIASEIHILNLFAYTGGSTMAAASAGANVTHVDASKGVVSWARENAVLNQLEDKPIRWIVDDVSKFVQREIRRGRQYQGLILDPPTYGRGAQGETWKIEEDLLPFLRTCRKLINKLDFIILSCHSPGFSGLVLAQMMAQVFKIEMDQIQTGEMVTSSSGGFNLPSGVFARWSRSTPTGEHHERVL